MKGSQAEKRLASQFIARFFKFFPKLQENAIDAMLDLCEDEDNMVSVKGRNTSLFPTQLSQFLLCGVCSIQKMGKVLDILHLYCLKTPPKIFIGTYVSYPLVIGFLAAFGKISAQLSSLHLFYFHFVTQILFNFGIGLV